MTPAPHLAFPPAPDAIFDRTGRPRLGAYTGSIADLALSPPGAARPRARERVRRLLRAKRWVYLLAGGDEALAGAAIVEAGLFGGAFLWVLDRRRGALAVDVSGAGLPGRHAEVQASPVPGARFERRGLFLRIEARAGRVALEARVRGGVSVDVELDPSDAPPPFTLVAPVPGAGPRATQKAGALRAEGRAAVPGRTLRLDGTGGLDVTTGLLARETAWRWAFGTGRDAAGAPLAFNLCAGFGLPAGDPGENVLLVPGPTQLPPVELDVDLARPLAPWRIAGGAGTVELAFRPEAVHRERKELALVRTRFAQVAGTFDGTVAGRRVSALPGVVEDHWARW